MSDHFVTIAALALIVACGVAAYVGFRHDRQERERDAADYNQSGGES